MRRRRAWILLLVLTGCSEARPAETRWTACVPLLASGSPAYAPSDAPLPLHFRSSTAGTVVFSDDAPVEHPITNAGATLGRVLFYDRRLSADGRIACSSCHIQEFGFADTVPFSRGVDGRRPARRTMALANARFNANGRYFWDERAPSLEAQVLQPIQDPREMGMELATLERKLAGERFYQALFSAAFGSPDVTRERIAIALAQFVRSLVSGSSRYDAVFATGGAPDPSVLTDQEQEGMRLFSASGCAGCHRSIAQFADQPSNNGLDVTPADSGAGRGRFKPPSLRNVAVRPPYMHDGRFRTLREVVEFYDRGVQPSADLDPRLLTPDGRARRLGLREEQIDALVAFLESLTDSSFLRDDRFADPFECA